MGLPAGQQGSPEQGDRWRDPFARHRQQLAVDASPHQSFEEAAGHMFKACTADNPLDRQSARPRSRASSQLPLLSSAWGNSRRPPSQLSAISRCEPLVPSQVQFPRRGWRRDLHPPRPLQNHLLLSTEMGQAINGTPKSFASSSCRISAVADPTPDRPGQIGDRRGTVSHRPGNGDAGRCEEMPMGDFSKALEHRLE